ncbi:autophagy protein 13, partial [Elasticomyces elasticus]
MQPYSRPAPTSASPATSEQTNPTRTNNSRDRSLSNTGTYSPQTGSSEDFTAQRQDSRPGPGPGPDPAASMQRLNQVIQNFHTKAALIVLHSRSELAPAYSAKTNEKRVNKWFNIELDETDDYINDIRPWKKIDITTSRPPPLCIEVYLTTDTLPQGQRLVITDDDQKRWDVYNAFEPEDS